MSVVVNHGGFFVRSRVPTSPKKLGPGGLVLVVGPSGSGKDTLLRGAAQCFAKDPHYVFPRRAITRQSDPANEDHDSLSMAEFEAIKQDDEAAFWWQAHGHGYVIPQSVEADVQAGKTVIFNASRGIIATAHQRFSSVAVVHISVPEEVLRSRIENRGRESGGDIEKRLYRAGMAWHSTDSSFEIINDRSVEDGVSRLVAIISDCANA